MYSSRITVFNAKKIFMFITDREKATFTDLYLRTCRSRDSIPVLLGLRALRTLGKKETIIRAVWDLVDTGKQNRLRYGQFLVACLLCIRNDHVRNIPAELEPSLKELATVVPPFALASAEKEEKLDLQAPDGMRSENVAEAKRFFIDDYIPIQEAIAECISALALRAENHAELSEAFSPQILVERITNNIKIDSKRQIASFLCSISSSQHVWMKHLLPSICLLTLETTDMHVEIFLLACIANSACDTSCAHVLLNSPSCVSFLRECVTRRHFSSESVRLILNICACVGIVKPETHVRDLLVEIFKPGEDSTLYWLDKLALKYLFELLSMIWGTPTYQLYLIHNLRMVDNLHNLYTNDREKFHEVTPQISLLLSKACSLYENHDHFVDQGGIRYAFILYHEFPLDEIIRLNVILIACALCESANSDRYIPELLKCGFQRILQDACETETHIEIVSRALDAWVQLATHSSDWGTALLTAIPLLLSESAEIKLKALSLILRLIEFHEQRRLLCGLGSGKDNTSKSSANLTLLLECLPSGDEKKRTIFDSCSFTTQLRNDWICSVLCIISALAKDDEDQDIGRILGECHVERNIMAAYPLVCEEAQDMIADTLGILLIKSGSSTRRSREYIDLLAMRMEKSSICLSALAKLMKDTAITVSMSKVMPLVIDMGQRNDIGSERSKSLSEIISLWSKTHCCHSTNPAFSRSDLIHVIFKFAKSACRWALIHSLKALHALLENPQLLFHDLIVLPSHMHLLVALGNHEDQECKLLAERIIAQICLTPAFAEIVASCGGNELPMFVRHLAFSNRTESHVLLCQLLKSPRVQRLVSSLPTFYENLVSALESGGIRELVECLNKGKVVRSERTVQNICFVDILAHLEGRAELVKIRLEIFQRLNLSNIARIPPTPSRGNEIELLRLLLSIVSDNTHLRLNLPNSTVKQRCMKFEEAAAESRKYFGETSLSQQLVLVSNRLTNV